MSETTIDNPALQAVYQALTGRFPAAVQETVYARGELSVRVAPADIAAVLAFLRDEQGFNALNDIIGLDNLAQADAGVPRFSVVYQLYKFPAALRLRVRVDVAENESLPSATALYKSADWAEREVFDMFGIRFDGHPGLSRIYMDDDFAGHPLRKDFPLAGVQE